MKTSTVVTSVCVVALAVGGWWGWQRFGGVANDGAAPPGEMTSAPGTGRGNGARESLVVAQPVGSAVTGDKLTAIGNGEAVASVELVPRDTGVLVEVAVVSGQKVEAGDVLARLDRDAEVIARDMAARAVEDALTTQQRRARLTRSQAGSQSELDEADATLARAQLTLRDAALKLERRDLVAPIEGVVGLVAVEVGDRVTPETPIVRIDDRTRLRVDFRVPERFSPSIAIGQSVEATPYALPASALRGSVSAIGSRVEVDSRTLPVQAIIDNADDVLRPGMSFSISLAFEGERLPAVDPLAVQWDSQGAYVWRVQDGSVSRVPIRIVQREPEAVLVAGELAPGDRIVTEGVLALREGAAVRIEGESSPRPDTTAPEPGSARRARDGQVGPSEAGRDRTS